MTTFTREDFELAAKAAGIPGAWDDELHSFVLSDGDAICPDFWNPPDDDGDALRLAVKLDISVFPPKGADGDFAVASIGDDTGQMPDTWIQEKVICGDMLAATRHAIFRAAIAIGKAMPRPTVEPKPDTTGAPIGQHPRTHVEVKTIVLNGCIATEHWRLAKVIHERDDGVLSVEHKDGTRECVLPGQYR